MVQSVGMARAYACAAHGTASFGGGPAFTNFHAAVTAALLACQPSDAEVLPMDATESVRLLQAAVALFAIAALGGITMAIVRFARGVNPPAWLAMLHGLLAGSGLTLLIWQVCAYGGSAAALAAVVLFVLAAAGGATLSLRYKWKQLLLPAWLVLAHALVAVAGFVALLYAAFAASG